MTNRERQIQIRDAKRALIELLSPGARFDAGSVEDPIYLSAFLRATLDAEMAQVTEAARMAAAARSAAAAREAAGGGAGGAAADARQKMIEHFEGVIHRDDAP